MEATETKDFIYEMSALICLENRTTECQQLWAVHGNNAIVFYFNFFHIGVH
jgi:hypothetical protein